jgi:glucose/arabinose dehydrogenase
LKISGSAIGPKNRFAAYILIAGAASLAVTLLLVPVSNNSVVRDQNIPLLHDPELAVELVADGLEFPTSMRFLGDGSILVLQKNDGQVRLVLDGRLLDEPVLQVDVAEEGERGLLGIAVWDGGNGTSVFLYMTEVDGEIRNRIYKYVYDEDWKVLDSRTLILDLPAEPGPFHNGGKIAIGHDGYLYAVIGDVNAGGGMLDNQLTGRPPDDKSVVLRVDRDTGMAAEGNPFYYSEVEELWRYYAYGIRNSFGMDFDPLTGRLWITENGPDRYDEINVVEPGFNSGWHKVMGPISRTNVTASDLVSFNVPRYGDPVFSWYAPMGLTDIEFFDSSNFGEEYENNVFVGDINHGNLYFFKVNPERDGLELDSAGLSDRVADPVGDDILGEVSPAIIGERFGRITDVETGPDGNLYVLSYLDGKIYRIVRK